MTGRDNQDSGRFLSPMKISKSPFDWIAAILAVTLIVMEFRSGQYLRSALWCLTLVAIVVTMIK